MGGSWFRCWAGHQLFWLMFVGFLSPSRQWVGWYLPHLGHDYFLNPFKFVVKYITKDITNTLYRLSFILADWFIEYLTVMPLTEAACCQWHVRIVISSQVTFVIKLCCLFSVFRVPKIELEKSKGLSYQHVVQLESELVHLAQKLKGEVMIFELAQHVQVSNLLYTFVALLLHYWAHSGTCDKILLSVWRLSSEICCLVFLGLVPQKLLLYVFFIYFFIISLYYLQSL
jgi:hypothetical protein